MNTVTSFINARPKIVVNHELREDISQRVLEAKVSQTPKGANRMELHLANWGQEECGDGGFLFNDFKLEAQLAWQKDHNHPHENLFEGEVIAIEERYGDGAPQLVLLAKTQVHPLSSEIQFNRSLTRLKYGEDVIDAQLTIELGENYKGHCVHGELVCFGNYNLSTGDEIELYKVSPRFVGRYRITNCMHQFSLNRGYQTHLQVLRQVSSK